jgi:hypothetical protein
MYSIFVDRCDSLPEPYRGRLAAKGNTLIYMGRSLTCLRARVVEQDFEHKRAATFFRAIGAILGYRPPRGSLKDKGNQNNYKFSAEDTKRIMQWINEHLSVRYVEVDPAEIPVLEPMAIAELAPLLNDVHNPDALPELRDLRAECRRIALT